MTSISIRKSSAGQTAMLVSQLFALRARNSRFPLLGKLTLRLYFRLLLQNYTDKRNSMKFNFKLEGINHRVKENYCGAPLGTMFVGADVTHPGKDNEACPSIAGIVATRDENCCNYLASARLQPSKTEVTFSVILFVQRLTVDIVHL